MACCSGARRLLADQQKILRDEARGGLGEAPSHDREIQAETDRRLERSEEPGYQGRFAEARKQILELVKASIKSSRQISHEWEVNLGSQEFCARSVTFCA
jgi:hypothetical protein